MKRMLLLGFALLCFANWAVLSARQSGVLLLRQDRDGAPAQNLSAAEMSSLGDPFFNLVLKEHADVTTMSGIENLLQPDATRRATFVVDESIADSRPKQARRVVLTFSGSNGAEVLDSNVMLSVFFSSEAFPDNQRFVEAWGWDNHRSRYNYYKLDRTGTPDQRMSWKLRATSENADLLSPSDRGGTCLACHVNGGPVMKELLFPWNNWHSFKSKAAYLTTTVPVSARWNVVSDPHLRRLQGAEDLEGSILPAINQFNTRRLNLGLAREDATGNVAVNASGKSRVREGRRLLKPLFVTTEYNIISASETSGLHKLAGAASGAAAPVTIPATFFLNAALIGQNGAAGHLTGLGIAKAADFGRFIVSAQDYSNVVNSSGVRLGGMLSDANFAWLTPEVAHIDTDMVDQLIQRGVVSPQFVAAALAVDLETPIFSGERAQLLRFIPDEFEFVAKGASHPDDLTTKVIAAISAIKPNQGSPEAKFLFALQSADPIKLLSDQMDAYLARITSRLNGVQTKQAEINRLFAVLIDRRQKAIEHEVLSALNETGDRLFPVP